MTKLHRHLLLPGHPHRSQGAGHRSLFSKYRLRYKNKVVYLHRERYKTTTKNTELWTSLPLFRSLR